MIKNLALACALAVAAGAATASQLPDYPFIHVSASAELRLPADIGTIDFDIAATDADPAAARAVVEARLAAIRSLFEQLALPVEDVEIRDVRQDIAKPQPGVTTAVYDLRCSVHLNVRDMGQWEALAKGLAGLANVDGFAVAFDTATREAVEAELMADAIRQARKRGEVIAAGFGRKLGAVSAVSTGPLKNLGGALGLVGADFTARTASRAIKVEAGGLAQVAPLKLSQSVDVVFRIKP